MIFQKILLRCEQHGVLSWWTVRMICQNHGVSFLVPLTKLIVHKVSLLCQKMAILGWLIK